MDTLNKHPVHSKQLQLLHQLQKWRAAVSACRTISTQRQRSTTQLTPSSLCQLKFCHRHYYSAPACFLRSMLAAWQAWVLQGRTPYMHMHTGAARDEHCTRHHSQTPHSISPARFQLKRNRQCTTPVSPATTNKLISHSITKSWKIL